MLQHYNTLSGIHEVQKNMTKPEGNGFKIKKPINSSYQFSYHMIFHFY